MNSYKFFFFTYAKKKNAIEEKRLTLIKEGLNQLNFITEENFIIINNQKSRKRNFFCLNLLLIRFLYLYFLSIKSIIKSKKKFKPIVYMNIKNSLFFSFSVLIFKIFNIKIIAEKGESLKVPNFLKKSEKIKVFFSSFLIKKFIYFCDIIFCNTDKLCDEIRPFNKNVKKLSSAIVDYDFFSNYKKKSIFFRKFNFKYICYSGSLEEEHNGAFTLLKAFAQLNKTYKNIYLVYVGCKIEQNYKSLIKSCKDLKVEKNVIFTNFLREENLKKFYQNALILAILKPFNERNTKNFPGKLSEYLSTGNPVISTSVGSISKNLENKHTAFLVEEFSISKIVETFEFILNNETLAKKVGFAGQLIAKKKFDKKNVAKNLIKSLKTI
jgi:glycosyltransferase involved in cell wall biosynthesis